MARRTARPKPTQTLEIPSLVRVCPACSGTLWSANTARRTVTTLEGLVRLRLQVRSCRNPDCPQYKVCLRPAAEGHFALRQNEFGLDVVALVGVLRHAEHRSVTKIHAELTRRGVPICVRSVSNLLDRYDELLALSCSDTAQLRRVTAQAGRAILAIDGMQPDVGHEVLWVIRDVLSGEILLARSLLSSSQDDLATLLREVREALDVPIAGVVSDDQTSIRKAVTKALKGYHELCHFHYLREAALPVYEADRHAKVQLKKKVRGIRPIERRVEGRVDPEAETIRGYCAAVRSSLTDEGRPPLIPSELKLADRLAEVASSLDRVGGKRGFPRNFFYEFANVKPWPVFFSSRLISLAISGPSPTRALRWVPGLAVLGEAGNPAILVSAQPRCQSLTIFPPGLAGLSCAFRLAASA